MRFQLFIDNTNVDLFDDEKIVLNRRLKDLNKLDSVVSDYTQNFSLPATKRNNKIFAHWYNVDVINGFNAHQKVDAYIEVDGLRTFTGIIELKSVSFNQYEPENYSVVFYGDTKKIATILGNKTLQDIDWGVYNHTRSAVAVTNSWSGNLLSGKILYPVIAWKQAFNYNASATTIEKNIAKSATDVEVYDLKPSILLTEMVKHIIEEQGYTTQGSFYTDSYFDDLYVAPSQYAGTLNRVQINPELQTYKSSYSFPASNSFFQISGFQETKDTTNSFNPIAGTYTSPNSGTFDFVLKTNVYVLASGGIVDIALFVNGTPQWQNSYTRTGVFTENVSISIANSDIVTLRYQTSDSGAQLLDIEFDLTGGPATNSDMSVNMGEVMPNIKASEFINGVLTTFNLVLVPISSTRIDIEPYQNWLDTGVIKDFTKYLDIENITHDKIDVPNELAFAHAETNDFVNNTFKVNNARDFGAVSTKPSVDFGNGKFEVKSPFSIFPQAYLKKFNSNGYYSGDSNIQVFHALDQDLNPIHIPFLLFYYNGLKSSDTWYFNTSAKNTFPIISPFSAEPTATESNSLAYSLESSLNGDAPTNTLLSKYWLGYLSRLFSTQSRKVTCRMFLPVGQWINLELNDTILLDGYYYKIDSVKYDLLTQEAQIVLLTYPDVEIPSVTSSTGNDFVITSAIESENGQSLIGVNSQSKNLFNILTINDETSTDAPNIQDAPLVLSSNVVVSIFAEQDLGGGGNETP